MVARSLTDEQELDMVDKYTNNKISTHKLSTMFGIGQATVYRILTRRGVEIRSRSENGPNHTYTYNESFFDYIDTEEKAYFFGILYADGNTNRDAPSITIKLQEDDYSVLQKLNSLISTNNRPLIYEQKKNSKHKNTYLLTIRNAHIKEVLVSYGMVPRKSLIKIFPEVILNSSEDIIRHFIRGYFDGNGFIGIYDNANKSGKYVSTCISTTLEMCNSIKEIYKQYLNIDCYIEKSDKTNDANNYKIWVYGKDRILTVLDWMYKDSTIKMERKYNKYLEAKRIPTKRRIFRKQSD